MCAVNDDDDDYDGLDTTLTLCFSSLFLYKRKEMHSTLLFMITKLTLCVSTLLVARPPAFARAFSSQIRLHHHQQLSSFAISTSASTLTSPFFRTSDTNTNTQVKSFLIRKMSTSSNQEAKKRVLVPIAEDSEEIETTCITDVLARFGAEVVVASCKSDGALVCKMSRGIKVRC